ncbi:hypothetical protein KEF29_00885 [Streptomyces tuirus]|uniref:Uncharacterized protein n=1 Tax=Streptomyces tuirus TaxID=68278 RepID=A0A941FBK7_9ACTN|nr:hypothetical protein [Streptomyces tuirus]
MIHPAAPDPDAAARRNLPAVRRVALRWRARATAVSAATSAHTPSRPKPPYARAQPRADGATKIRAGHVRGAEPAAHRGPQRLDPYRAGDHPGLYADVEQHTC